MFSYLSKFVKLVGLISCVLIKITSIIQKKKNLRSRPCGHRKSQFTVLLNKALNVNIYYFQILCGTFQQERKKSLSVYFQKWMMTDVIAVVFRVL